MHPKMMCIWKPAQSGKTRTMIEEIRARGLADYLNIIICSNNRLLVAQTTKRMGDADIGNRDVVYDDDEGEDEDDSTVDDYIDTTNKIFSWMTGTGKPNTSVGALADEIKEDNVLMVCCCSHKARFIYIKKLLENLNSSRHFTKKVNIWIDEADVSVKTWSNPNFAYGDFGIVDRIVLISATFEKIFDRYKQITIQPFSQEEIYNAPTYLRLAECEFVIADSRAGAPKYLADLVHAHPEMCEPGSKVFAPGDITVASHDEIATILKVEGFAVMVLNGQRKVIILPDGSDPIPVPFKLNPANPSELSIELARLYEVNNLSRFPFAVTGQLCLGRGITFQSDTFMFGYGVIPHIGDPSAASQCISRMIGNIKLYPGFAKPTIYCSELTKNTTKHLANVAENISRIAGEKGWNTLTRDQIHSELGDREPCTPPKVVVDPNSYRIYKDVENLCDALKIVFPSYRFSHRTKKSGDFFMAACGGPAAITSLPHAIKNIHNLTGGGEAATRYIPVYTDMNDPGSLHYVMVMPRIPKEMISAAGSRMARDKMLAEIDAKIPCIQYA